MTTREVLSKIMNMSTKNPEILDMDVEFPCNSWPWSQIVDNIYVENGKLMLDC